LKKKYIKLLTILFVFSVFGISQVSAVTPNYFDVTIDIAQIYLWRTGDGWFKGEVYFKVINRGGVTLLDTIGNTLSLGKGEHTISGVSVTCERYVPNLDYFIIEMWDKDLGADDLLLRTKLFIKLKSTEGTIYYTGDNWLHAWTVGIYGGTPYGYQGLWHRGDDETYVSFIAYDCVRDYCENNDMWIEATIDYYYSSIG